MSKNIADMRMLLADSLKSGVEFHCEGDPATAETVEIDLYGLIDDFDFGDGNGMTAKNLADELKKYPNAKNIIVNINSPGGSVFAAAAMTNILTRHQARKIVNIDGMAASAASVVAMAGDDIRMAENSLMMIHNPWVMAVGDEADLKKASEALAKIKGTIVATYAARTGQKAENIAVWMNEETWFTAAEAKENGFATEIMPAKKAAALAGNMAALKAMNYRHIPDSISDSVSKTPADGAGESHNTPGGEQPPADKEEIPKMADTKNPAGQGNTPPAPAPANPAPAAASEETKPKNEGQKFLDAFGDKGGVWYAQGKTFDEARDLYVADLKAENKALTEQVADLQKKVDAAKAATGSDESATAGDAEGGKPKSLKSMIKIRKSA